MEKEIVKTVKKQPGKGIFEDIRENKQKYLDEFKKLYEQGLNDSQIAAKLEVSYVTPRKWRIALGLPKNFKYSVSFDEQKFKELQEQGLNYSQIAKQLGVSASAAQAYGAKQGFTTNYLKYESIEFTAEEFQVFLGTMYGDASMTKYSRKSNARLSFAHSLKQQNYCLWKYKKLQRFCSKPRFDSNLDKRTNKVYDRIDVVTKANPLFTKYYDMFYKTVDGKKTKYLNIDLLQELEPLGLAVWFMDDGYKHSNSISIATNCFAHSELEQLVIILKNKFNLHFTICDSTKVIHLSAKDLCIFINLVEPYIHPDCAYKINWCSLNSVKQGKTKEVVPVLNPQETEEKAKRLDVTPTEKDEAIKSSTKAGHCSE
jgi:predicted transcriptional regulator